EYWFNNDYSNRKDSAFAATSLLNLHKMLDVSSLNIGFHFVSLRLQDEQGKWGPVASWYFTKENQEDLPELHQLTAFEYWFNGDYSTVQADLVTTSSQINLNTLLDVSTLNDGLHIISTRFRDEAGKWSPAFSQLFAKFPVQPTPNMRELTALEYWFNGDISSSVRSAIPTGSEYLLDTQLDISALSDGLHSITYRFQDETGVWGPAYSELLSKYEDEVVTTGNKITGYRYWADDQIAFAIEVDLATPLKSLNLDEVVDVSSLPGGTHNISFQFRDSLGMWSSAYTESYSQDYNPRGTITAETDPACSNSVVTFTAETTDVDSIYWDFGDTTAIVGRTASENAYHAYSKAGTYIISATLLNLDSAYTATATTNITINQSYGVSVVAPENLVTYYPLDGDATDASENGHDGTVSGATLTEDRNGTANSAYLFDGNDGISIQHSDELNMSEALSFSCWIKPAVLQNAMIFGKSNYTSATNYLLRIQSDGNLQWEYNGFLNTTTRPLEADKWYNIVVTANNPGEYRQIYVNGQLVAETISSSGPFGSITNPLTIGYASRGAEYFKGVIDDLRMYNKVLSPPEIFQLYQGTKGSTLPPIEAEICASEVPYTFGSQQLSTSGIYYETYPTVDGCDSVVQLNLTVHPTYNDTIGDPSNSLVMDDFESGTLGTLPSGWVIRYNGTGNADQKIVNTPVKYGAQSFQVSGSSWAANLSKPVSEAHEKTTLEGWMYATNVTSGGRCGMGLGNPSIGSWGAFPGRVESYNGNLITFNYSGSSGGYGTQYVLQPATSNTWYHLGMEFDFPAGKYKVFVNGTQATSTSGGEVVSEFPILNGVTPTSVELYGNSMVYFDDVKLYESGSTEIVLCSSETPYAFGSQMITKSGTYNETFHSEFGCDSIVTLNLTINPTYEIPIAASICEGNSYLFNGKQLSLEGVYKDTLQTINGCDSVLILTLNVDPALETSIEASICEGDSYNFGGQILSANGTYRDTLQSVSNCDSIVVLTLDVNPVYEIQIDSAICEGESVSFAGETITTSGIYKDTLQTDFMCDSIMILNLEVKPVYDDSTSVSICEGDSYNFGGTDYNISGKYVHIFTSVSGCDSVVTLQLTVNPKIYKTIDTAICQGDLYAFAGTAISTAGEYKDTLTAASGCDSIVTLNLTVNPIYETPVDASICEGDAYIFGDKTLTIEGIYKDTLISISNCDSVIVLNLTVNPVYEIPADTAICTGNTYPFGGELLTESGIYRDTLQTITGCDSIIILSLTVNDIFNVVDTVSICQNELPDTFGTQLLYADAVCTETFPTVNGCDSTVTLVFTVSDTFSFVFADTVCENNLP
ncbi:MAG: LamG-like jellyroll fold domain-containing protein, partial [Draconibacterium sp.]